MSIKTKMPFLPPLQPGEKVKIPKNNPLEASVEKRLYEGVTAYGGECVKLQLLPGWPDRLILWPNAVTHLVETKRPKGSRFQPLQLRVHKRLRALGYVVLVLYTRQQVDAYLQKFRPEPRSGDSARETSKRVRRSTHPF